MGDMADYYLSMELVNMTDPDYEEEPYEPEPKKMIVCRHCGAGGLIWGQTASGWKLYNFESEAVHVCPTR